MDILLESKRSVAIGVGCGLLVGWILRAKCRPTVKLMSMNNELESGSVGVSDDFKLILVVRSDLKMGKGKIAAQCSHASVIAYKQLKKKSPDLLQQWELHGQPKVVVKTPDEESMMSLVQEAQSHGLLVSLVCDAGRTQIAPGSKTVIGVGPGPKHLVDKVTGHLKLL